MRSPRNAIATVLVPGHSYSNRFVELMPHALIARLERGTGVRLRAQGQEGLREGVAPVLSVVGCKVTFGLGKKFLGLWGGTPLPLRAFIPEAEDSDQLELALMDMGTRNDLTTAWFESGGKP